MAKRTISTRLAIEGEAAYKQAIAGINAELRNHKSALDLVNSQYKGNANSMDALQAKQKALSDLQTTQAGKVKELNAAYQNAQTAVDAYGDKKEELTQKITANEEALEKLKNTEGDTTEEQKKLTEETAKLKAELENNEAKLTAAQRGTDNWQTSLNKAQIELNKTNDEIKKNDQHLEEAKKSTDKAATSIDKFGKETKTAGESVDALGSALAAAGIVAALKQMADALIACAEASIQFETAMTGVEKTTNLSTKELADMSDSLKDLSGEIPMTASELAKIAENAGQLGIQKENIVGFTNVMADLGVATNLSGEQAAQTFAKFANITKMAQTDFDKLGSTIVDLGNNLATTEADIADMGMRLAAAGTQAGMSQADILGLAGALSSVGMESQAGGTAFSKAINMMTVAVETGNDQLIDFATVAGMSAQEFARAYKEDAAGAVVAFTEGLGDMETHGKSAVVLLEELGLTEIRLRDSLTRAASAGDLFRESIERGNTAWAENTALTREAQLFYGTTESRLKLLDNSFNRLKITIGDQLNPALDVFIGIGTSMLDWVDDFITENEWLVPVLSGVTVALGVLSVAMVFLSATVQAKVIPAIVAMGKALMANPVLLVVAGVAALVTALISLSAVLFKADEDTQKLTGSSRALAEEMNKSADAYTKSADALEAQSATTGTLIERLKDLTSKTSLTAAEQSLLEGTVSRLSETYPELNSLMGWNSDELTLNTSVLKQNIPEIIARTKALKDQQEAEQRRDRIIELVGEENRAKAQLAANDRQRQQLLAGFTEEQRKNIEAQNQEAIAIMYLDENARTAFASLKDLASADKELQKSLKNTTTVLEVEQEQLELNAEAYAKYGISMDEYTAATQNMTAAQKEKYEATLEGQKIIGDALDLEKQKLDDLAVAHEAAWLAAYNNINNAIGLFEDMSIKGDKSIKDLIGSLDSQITYMDTYGENIRKAMERGVDKGLVEKLSDGSKESAEILAGIVQGGEDDIKKLNEKFAGVEDGKKQFAGTMADMETEFGKNMDAINKKLEGLVKDMNKADEAAAAARETGESYAAGLGGKRQAVYNASASLARAASEGWKDYYQQRSPARLAIAEAAQTADSYAMGFEQRIKHMEDTTAKFAIAANDSYTETMRDINIQAAPIIYNFTDTQKTSNIRPQNNGDIVVHVYGDGMIVRNEQDIKKISESLAAEAQRKIAARGGIN